VTAWLTTLQYVKRSEQRAATRAALAEAALRLFAERGVEATPVEEIAAAAGVTSRTFFHHFHSKAEAAFADHEENIRRFGQALDRIDPKGDPLADVCSVIIRSIEEQMPSDFRRARYGLVETNEAIREFDARTDRDYEILVAAHLRLRWGDGPRTRMVAEATANMVIGVARAVLLAWGRDGLDPAEEARELFAALTRSALERMAASGR